MVFYLVSFLYYSYYGDGVKDANSCIYDIEHGRPDCDGKGIDYWKQTLSHEELWCSIWHLIYLLNSISLIVVLVWFFWLWKKRIRG